MKKLKISFFLVVCMSVIAGSVVIAISYQANAETQQEIQAVESCIVKKLDSDTNLDLKEYEQYEKYGLLYKEKYNRFYYKGKVVRKFIDKKDKQGNLNGFSYSDGVLDLEAKRDSNFQLIGIVELEKEKFNENTEKLDSIKTMENINSFEEGNGEHFNEILDSYIPYGITYNNKRNIWQYDGKDIYIFYDEKGEKLLQGEVDIENSISLYIKRDTKEKIDKISVMNKDDILLYEKQLIQ